jgi:hypothetical protein
MERRGIMTGGTRRQKRRRQLRSIMKDPSNLNDCGVSTIIQKTKKTMRLTMAVGRWLDKS